MRHRRGEQLDVALVPLLVLLDVAFFVYAKATSELADRTTASRSRSGRSRDLSIV